MEPCVSYIGLLIFAGMAAVGPSLSDSGQLAGALQAKRVQGVLEMVVPGEHQMTEVVHCLLCPTVGHPMP